MEKNEVTNSELREALEKLYGDKIDGLVVGISFKKWWGTNSY